MGYFNNNGSGKLNFNVASENMSDRLYFNNNKSEKLNFNITSENMSDVPLIERANTYPAYNDNDNDYIDNDDYYDDSYDNNCDSL